MSNEDPFSVKIACPLCGNADALMTLSAVKCPNPKCANFAKSAPSAAPVEPPAPPLAAPEQPKVQPPSPAPSAPKPKAPEEPFNPAANRIEIKYRNYKGEEKTFTGDGSSARANVKHLSIRIGPTGRRVALAKDRILNWKEIAAALPSLPRIAGSPPPAGCGCLILLLIVGGIILLLLKSK